ncbi:sulfotransferase [Thermosipho sp. (in: thermotogales)]|uniref:sulfotransferase n=1 Tax=Thermosipho sp. (in: thermotogales) TaxID=1968895 RepID=UPI002579D5AE|nr:sulfotransferase [Thermosipho sp. (in: thermotogales)]MBZ4651138.1 sulfotransferase [Thermosipho sp. (in: thermotogales)]
MGNDSKRKKEFERNKNLEIFLEEVNNDLWNSEKELLKNEFPELPLLFIVGPHRSGTTLVLQWLANTNEFAYPTNLLSRFYKAPIVGAKIQRLLTDEKYNYRNEILDFDSKINYESENGKTKGAVAPNEFWYFWRRFLPFGDLDYLPSLELKKKVNIELLKKELYGIANVFEKPFALKALIMNYNIDFLDTIFENALFIYTKRDPLTNIESALEARIRQYGDVEKWYSFKIPEYNELIKMKDPILQTAGQIYYINKAVKKGLEKVKEDKKIIFQYEDFCDNPEKYYYEIRRKLMGKGHILSKDYKGPSSFRITRSNAKDQRIEDAYNYFLQKYGE